MNQRNQQRSQGQRRDQGQGRQQTDNNQETIQKRTAWVLGELNRQRHEIEVTLPIDIPFDLFHATCAQALMSNPKILVCTGDSIVRACVKSAYDGLRLDGREAAIVEHKVKIAQNPDRWESQAQYFPMVRGLIKKILLGGMVIAMEAEVIYRNDVYHIQRGTDPKIHHEPLLDGDRGKPIAVYSIATLRDGTRVAEVMTASDIAEVRAAAKTDFVWKAWEAEMWRKSVVRRHEKKLPSGREFREFRDAEAMEMFPQYQREAPALTAVPPRPTRPNPSLPAPEQTVGYDLGQNLRDAEREETRNWADGRADTSIQNQREKRAETKRDDLPQDGKRTDVPVGPEELAAWATEFRENIEGAKNMGAANDLWVGARDILAALETAEREELEQLFTDRMADLASDDGAGAAEATDSPKQAAETN